MSKNKKRRKINTSVKKEKNENLNVEQKFSKEEAEVVEKNEDKVKEKFDIKKLPKQYCNFYKNNIRKKQIILFIISVVILGVVIYNYISNLDNKEFLNQIQNINEEVQEVSLFERLITNKIPICLILIIAGVTPYIYVSVLGIFTGNVLAYEIIEVLSNSVNSKNIVLMMIGAIIQIIGFSLASANGMHWCSITGKKNKYQNSKNKSFFDIKQEYYNLRGDKKKLKELEQKKKQKIENGKKYNVEFPTNMFIVSFIISVVLVIIGTFIFYI